MQQPIVGQGVLITEVSRSHSDTPHSVGILWMSNHPTQRPLPDKTHTPTNKQTSMPPRGFEPNFPPSELPQTLYVGLDCNCVVSHTEQLQFMRLIQVIRKMSPLHNGKGSNRNQRNQ